MVGRTLGHYRIVGKLGEGGMGVVYRAHDERLDRDVAIKVLPASSFRDATARARLLREARAAAALNHPHICTIHEVGEAEGQAYIAMEFVEGQALSVRLAGGGLPAEQVLRYGVQLADALEHAHERGVVHRDLKSANVIITPEGRAKVLDFGLAKRMSGEELAEAVTRSEATLTGFGALVGTVPYMAPEQLLAQPADARSDVWALGVVLYEMAAGERPFQGKTGFELSSGILNHPPRPLPPEASPGLRAVIDRCLEKEPGRRYQRGGEVRAALEAVQTGAVAPWAGVRYALARRRWLALVAVVVVLVAAGVGVDVLRRRLAGGARAPRIESLAVLPLENLSGDPGQEYFADGMTEELITGLARLAGLKRVIARGSVMGYKGTRKPPPEIARELKVDALITGAVLRSGNRVRITAQLINPATGEQLWSDRYEGDRSDVLTLQSEVTRAIAEAIKVKLAPEEKARLASARPVNPEAYEAYLQGRFHWQKLSPESYKTALQYFQLALEKDPNYALAYAGMSTAWLSPAHMGFQPPREALAKAKGAALKAVELDGTLAEAHYAKAAVNFFLEWDWPATGRKCQRTVELNPNFPDVHQIYADFLLLMGRPQEALPEIQRALDLDPLNAFAQAAVGGRLLRVGRNDEGIALLQKALRTEPNMGLARRYLWTAFHQMRMYPQALAEAKTFFTLAGQGQAAEAMARGSGYPGAMKLAAEKLSERSKQSYVQPSEIARLYAYAGEKDKAFAWLDRAYEARDTWLVWLKDDPRFESLHSDPRFQSLLRRMNIPE